ncbi:MAG: hypothetical protein LBS73_06950 [Campylobacteraceae bacterium]|jgi:amino acid transporter|nr:hypothetical protein [Campylobacteraceae bacterium]
MEFIMYTLIAISVFLVWRKPAEEKLAFRLFWAGSAMSIILFLIAVSSSFVPAINL